MNIKNQAKKTFLGNGWSFPPTFSKRNNQVEMTEGKVDIDRSLEILLSTRLGERIMEPTYGCDMSSLTFESMTTSFATYLKDMIKTAILYHEPRIKVESILLDTSAGMEGKVIISIEYTIRTSNTRSNMVFPYYIDEATNR